MKKAFLLSFFIAALGFATTPNLKIFSGSTGTVEFHAIGRPSALKIKGVGGAPSGQVEFDGKTLKGEAVFRLESLDTGIRMRNDHMKKKYLEIEKFPEAKLTVDPIQVSSPITNEKSEPFPFQGKLFLHGVEKPLQGTLHVSRDESRFLVEARFGLKISDFAIATPGFAGITMAEDVDVRVQWEGSENK